MASGRATRELIVAAVVILMLAFLLAPYVLRQRVGSRRNLCEFRQVELAKAIARYENSHQRYPGFRWPLLSAGPAASALPGENGSPPIGWIFATFPFLELPAAQTEAQSVSFPDLFARHGLLGPPDVRGTLPEITLANLLCPDDPRSRGPRNRSVGSFVANTGMPDADPTEAGPFDWPANGMLLDAFTVPLFPVEPLTLQRLTEGDGAENTLLVSENLDSGPWTGHEESEVGFLWVAGMVDGQPDPGDELLRINQRAGQGDGSRRFARPSGRHPEGVNVVYASGRSQFLSQQIDYLAYARLMVSDSLNLRHPGGEQSIDPPYRSEIGPASSAAGQAANGVETGPD